MLHITAAPTDMSDESLEQADRPEGMWPRVRAHVRPAQEWELPAGAGVRDQRVVEFWHESGSRHHMVDDIGWYAPLQAPDLLGKFTHVFAGPQSPKDKAVISFYAQYGPLQEFVIVDARRLPAWTQRLEPQHQERLSSEARNGLLEPLWWVREKAQEARLTYDLYAGLRERDIASLRAMLGDVPSGKRIISIYILAGQVMRDLVDERDMEQGPNLSQQEGVVRRAAGSFSWDSRSVGEGGQLPSLRPMTEEEATYWAKRVLADQLNAAEQRSFRRWVAPDELLRQTHSREEEPKGAAPEDRLELMRMRAFNGLMTAIYLQIADLLERGAMLRHCPGCQRLYYPARSDQIYCDVRCGEATRQRQHYAERKQSQPPAPTSRRRSRKAGDAQA
jgi:hypothetical protein